MVNETNLGDNVNREEGQNTIQEESGNLEQ